MPSWRFVLHCSSLVVEEETECSSFEEGERGSNSYRYSTVLGVDRKIFTPAKKLAVSFV